MTVSRSFKVTMNNKILAVDSRISENSRTKLDELGFTIIKIPQNPMFDGAVSGHSDMFISKINGELFVDNSVKELFTFVKNVKVLNREAVVSENIYRYPEDIEFNCVHVGKSLICNRKHTHSEIIKYAENNNINIINVNQGYAKCSVCVVSDNAIITEDDSIAKNATENGIDVLQIKKGFVKLPGYDYGFIGGCSGLIEKELIVFNGNIENHPDFDRIHKFCEHYNVKILSLSDEVLCDIGTIYRIC